MLNCLHINVRACQHVTGANKDAAGQRPILVVPCHLKIEFHQAKLDHRPNYIVRFIHSYATVDQQERIIAPHGRSILRTVSPIWIFIRSSASTRTFNSVFSANLSVKQYISVRRPIHERYKCSMSKHTTGHNHYLIWTDLIWYAKSWTTWILRQALQSTPSTHRCNPKSLGGTIINEWGSELLNTQKKEVSQVVQSGLVPQTNQIWWMSTRNFL